MTSTTAPNAASGPQISTRLHRPGRRPFALGVAGSVAALMVFLSGCGDTSDHATSGPTQSGAGRLTAEKALDTPSDECTGTLADVTVSRVRVPAGASCRLFGTKVAGDVAVGPGASLSARRVVVQGDLTGRAAGQVLLTGGSRVSGNVELTQGSFAAVRRNEVGADLRWTMQAGPLVVRRALVGGNVALDQNRGVLVSERTRIGGDLTGRETRPMPTRRANAVGGRRGGQC